MWIQFVLAFFVVAICESIGLYQQAIQYGPQLPIPLPVQKIVLPSERSYHCSCTDGINTRNIPIRENDPNFAYIANYFTQPLRNIVTSVSSYFQNPQGPGIYGQLNVPNYGNKQYYQQPGINGIGYSPDCLKNINYATTPCMAALINNLQSRYQLGFPGIQLYPGYTQQQYPQVQSPQPGSLLPSGAVKFSGVNSFPNGNINANLNLQQSGMQLQSGVPQGGFPGTQFQPGVPQGGLQFQAGVGAPQGLQGGAKLFGAVGAPGFGFGNGINANLNANLNANVNGMGAGFPRPGMFGDVRSPMGVIRSNLPTSGENGDMRSNLPAEESAEGGTEVASGNGPASASAGTDQPQTQQPTPS